MIRSQGTSLSDCVKLKIDNFIHIYQSLQNIILNIKHLAGPTFQTYKTQLELELRVTSNLLNEIRALWYWSSDGTQDEDIKSYEGWRKIRWECEGDPWHISWSEGQLAGSTLSFSKPILEFYSGFNGLFTFNSFLYFHYMNEFKCQIVSQD